MNLHAVLAYNVADIRQRKGLTLGELSETSGVSVRTILKIEHIEHNVKCSVISRLADGLGVRPARLLTPPRKMARQESK